MRDLRRRNYNDAPFLHVCIADRLLDVAMLDGLRLIRPLDDAQPGRGRRFLIAALANFKACVRQHIVRARVVQDRRAGHHRLLRREHDGVFLILHTHQPRGAHGGHLVFSDDSSDIIAPDTHALVEQPPVGDILMRRFGRPWMPRRREFKRRRVEAGDDLYNARYRQRGRQIKRLDAPVGHGAAHHLCNQAVCRSQIIRIFGPAGHLLACIHADGPAADSHLTSPLIHLIRFVCSVSHKSYF